MIVRLWSTIFVDAERVARRRRALELGEWVRAVFVPVPVLEYGRGPVAIRSGVESVAESEEAVDRRVREEEGVTVAVAAVGEGGEESFVALLGTAL